MRYLRVFLGLLALLVNLWAGSPARAADLALYVNGLRHGGLSAAKF